MHGAEQPIDAFPIRRARILFQGQQILNQIGQMFFRFAHEFIDGALGENRGDGSRPFRWGGVSLDVERRGNAAGLLPRRCCGGNGGDRTGHGLGSRRLTGTNGGNLFDQLRQGGVRQAALLARRFCGRAKTIQGIHAAEQYVHAVASQLDLPALRGHKTVFQVMGHLHGRVETDDLGCALDRMGRAHQRFQSLGIVRRFLQGQQPFIQSAQVGFELGAEQIQ